MRYTHIVTCGMLGVSAVLASACAVADGLQGERPDYYEQNFPAPLAWISASTYFDGGPQLALAQAISDDDVGGMRAALAAGAKVDVIGRDGMTPLFWALAKESPEALEFLLQEGADPNQRVALPEGFGPKTTNALSLALRMENPVYMRLLLEHGGNPDTTSSGDPGGWPLIRRASLHDYPFENVKLLVEHGADVNARGGSDKGTAISEAVQANHFHIALYLLRAGADPTLRTVPTRNEWVMQERGSNAIDQLGWWGGGATLARQSRAAREAYPIFVRMLKDRGLIPEDWEYNQGEYKKYVANTEIYLSLHE